MNIPHRINILIPLAAASLLFLAGCGNKGPLVLPQQPVPMEEVAEPVPAADDATPTTPQDNPQDGSAPAPAPETTGTPEATGTLDGGNR